LANTNRQYDKYANSMNDSRNKLLSVLSDDTMVKILIILSSSPSSTRSLSRILGVRESSISKRLKSLERLGLVEGKWVSSRGVNQKLYSMKVSEISIRIGPQGISVDLGEKGQNIYDPFHYIPSTMFFVGREPQLDFLRRGDGATFIVGIAGIGKTSLAARYASEYMGPVLWNKISEGTSFFQLIRRISLFLASIGDYRLLESLSQGSEDPDHLTDLLIDSLKKIRSLIVIDDYHLNNDSRIDEMIRRLSGSPLMSRVLVISRKKPSFYVDRERILILPEMSKEDSRALATNMGVSQEDFEEAYSRVGGVPQFLILWFNAIKKGLTINSSIDELSEYIVKEILERMDDGERLVLEFLSILRKPEPYRLLKRLGIRRDALRSSITSLERSMLVNRIGDLYYVNEVIRDIVRAQLVDPEELHAIAASYYASTGSEEDVIEALYHYLMAKDLENVARIIPRVVEPMFQAKIPPNRLKEVLSMVVDRYRASDPLLEGWVYLVIGIVKKLEGFFSEGLEYLEKAVSRGQALGDPRLAIYSMIERSTILRQMGRYTESLRELEGAMQISRRIMDKVVTERVLYNMAVTSFFLGDLDTSERFFKEALYRYTRSGDRFREALSLGWLGIIYRVKLITEASFETLAEASKIFTELGARHSLSIAYREMASTYFVAGKLGEAIASLENALRILDRESYPHLVAGILLDMSIYRTLIGNIREAEKDLGDAKKLIEENRIEDPEYIAITALSESLLSREGESEIHKHLSRALRMIDGCGIYRKIFITAIAGKLMASLEQYRSEGKEIEKRLRKILRDLGADEKRIDRFLDILENKVQIVKNIIMPPSNGALDVIETNRI